MTERITEAELIDALSRPTAYPHGPASVELVQTHLSLVFLAGDRVYKVKKPLDLGFVDYTTLERRRRFCDDEVRLNHRLAPGVYQGVVPITRDPDGRLRVDGDGETLEVAVEMLRLPRERMLDRLLAAGEIDNEQMNALAEMLALFHAEARTGEGVDEYGTPEAVAFNVRENFEQTEAFAAEPGSAGAAGVGTITPTLHTFLRVAAERFLTSEHELLQRRLRGKRIRDGHGDLHAGNVCMTDEGIRIYDRIEFAPRFRCGDVACDLAFLAMDLDLRGYRGFAHYLVRRYRKSSRDPELDELMTFYKSYRAIVRAKVASLTAVALELSASERELKRLEAMRYFHLATSYALPPVLILMCGLPASGKTTAARNLAQPFEAIVLRSDLRRKQLAGVRRTERATAEFGSGIYAEDMTARTYRALLAQADVDLVGRRSVVVDASFGRAAQREPFLNLAKRHHVPFVVIETMAPEGVIRARMEKRSSDRAEVSDADFAVYLRMREVYERPQELPNHQVVQAPPDEPGEELVARTLDRLVAQKP